MKKRIITVLVVMGVLASLAGCGAKTECDFCGKMKNCSTRTIWGQEVHYCKDCAEEINSMFK